VAARRLQFAARLHDGDRPVANGHITRVVVDAAAFLRDAGAEAVRSVSCGWWPSERSTRRLYADELERLDRYARTAPPG